MKYLIESKCCNAYELAAWKRAVQETQVDAIFYDGYFIMDDYVKLFPPHEKVVSFASIGLCNGIIRKTSWTPGVFPLDMHKYDCSNYYPILYNYLLNQDFCLLPYRNFVEQRSLTNFWKDGCIFVRPNSGLKTFAGGIVSAWKFKSDFDTLVSGVFDIEDNVLVLVSSPKNIEREYRVIMYDDEVITASLYKYSGRLHCVNEVEDKILDFAREVGTKYRNKDYYSLDICVSNGKIRVLEVGGLSCAGLYACDRVKILEHIEKNECFGDL